MAAARAFIRRSALIFANEPTGGLEAKSTVEVMELLAEIAVVIGYLIPQAEGAVGK